ncbi:MAG: flagellar basal body rod protein FlgB [Selenomonadaceae bacterium]|jgi:flagellar basal-body rod protein FlgB|uniref:flagellar basal body rod protein FlgB n=1 Tax=Selenomonas TaxID=970 RepID=UPI0028052E15|nr:flagellar basal body rod protein FlgB [uncultured Selenomonas sp.]MCI6752577.1 flagellar basal body rod protein FlgB [Selenomonas bovis]MDY6272040.1 flagellar basal body rod protein FlgB [Selenomonadaceae bacterium]MDY6298715.1 flagellar basal body rod protein FlgB [Selenomonadaceae bacterium]
MLEQIMNSSNFNYLGRGLAAANLRQEVISNNIANVNTPNFKKSDVVFEELLAKEIGMDDSGRLPLVRTHDRHLPVGMIGGAKASIQEDDTTTMRVDNNNVDIDIEMASLAKNQLYYNAMATELGGYVNKLKNVITSGQS